MISRKSLASTVLAAAAVALLAVTPVSGQSANFTTYAAIGDSLTAAFASGGLLRDVQVNSYPALIHRQAGGGGTFEQPLVGAPGAPPLLDLVSLSPLTIRPRASANGLPLNLTLPRPYNNMAVPGYRIGDVVRSRTRADNNNPLTDLILRNPNLGNTTALQQALGLRPTFVTLWIGNNDVLAAATSGLVIEGVTLTPVAQFQTDFNTILGAIRAAGANVAVATIPNVTAIPFVNTIPPFVVNPATSQPVLVNGQRVPLIGPGGVPLSLNDKVLLPASAALAQGIGIPRGIGNGTGAPLGDQFVLSANEVAAILARTAAYNNIIRAAADASSNVALVDMNVIFDRLAARGLSVGGLNYTTAFLSGGMFSYDGVHPTPFGYAFVANQFIKAINAEFGGNIPQVDLFPFTFGSAAAAGTLVGSDVSVAKIRYTPAAFDQLRRSLSIPPINQLLELAARPTPPAGDTPAVDGPGPDGAAPGETHGGNLIERPELDGSNF